jgi:hypothetical protein
VFRSGQLSKRVWSHIHRVGKNWEMNYWDSDRMISWSLILVHMCREEVLSGYG